MIYLCSLLAVFLLLSLSPLVASQGQTIIPAAEPQCLYQCPIFQQALAACNSDSAVQASWNTCFCQFSSLQLLKTSNANACAPQCTDADFGTIEAWYTGFCANDGGVPAGTTATPDTTLVAIITTTTTPPPANTSPATTTSSAGATGATEASNGEGADDGDNQYVTESPPVWFHDHWQWVLMIIVLAVAFVIIGVGGTFWYRRHKNHREYGDSTAPARGTASHPEMSQWAPGQHSVHDFGAGPGASYVGPDRGSPQSATDTTTEVGPHGGKGKEATGVSQVESGVQSPVSEAPPVRAPSRRLTKTPVGEGR